MPLQKSGFKNPRNGSFGVLRSVEEKSMEETAMEDGDKYNNRDMEVAPALIAVHPTRESITVVVGSDLRVFNLLDSIRAIRYDVEAKILVTAGDDKLFKIWNTDA